MLHRQLDDPLCVREEPRGGWHEERIRVDVDPELLVLDTGPCRDLDSPAL